jgi:hypothetical protein
MKKTALSLTLIVSTISLLLLVSSQRSPLTTANILPFEPANPTIIIESPINNTYNVNSLTLNVTIKTMKTLFEGENPMQNTTRLVTYSLDGENPTAITETSYDNNVSLGSNVTYTGFAVLPKLTYGPHNITVYAEYDYDHYYEIYRESETSVFFAIDTAVPFPTLLVMTASGTCLAIAGIGLLVYLKKLRRSKGP